MIFSPFVKIKNKIIPSLTLSWRRPLSYRNQPIDLLCKSMDWFLYDNDPRHERVKMMTEWNLYLLKILFEKAKHSKNVEKSVKSII